MTISSISSALSRPSLATRRLVTLLALVALLTSGCSLFAFGNNLRGQLGNGEQNSDANPSATPVASDSPFTSISPGAHSCGIRNEAELWCWGYGGFGALGQGTSTDHVEPRPVGGAGAPYDYAQVAVGGDFTCAVAVAGTLWCWGQNHTGQLGLGHNLNTATPTQAGTASDWVQVQAGNGHACALNADDELWCWGLNNRGQLGLGDNVNGFSPERVGTNKWTHVSLGTSHTCAIRTNETVWCWGSGDSGKLGQGDTNDRLSPDRIAGDNQINWKAIGAAVDHTCAVRSDDTIECWGNNAEGAFGTGDLTASLVPVQGGGGLAVWDDVVASYRGTCARHINDTVWCWGRGNDGATGLGQFADQHTPAQVAVPDIADVTAGGSSICVVTLNGKNWCWGTYRAGDGRNLGTTAFPYRLDTELRWDTVAAGGIGGCGISSDKLLYCWGENDDGYVGVGTNGAAILSPTRIPELGDTKEWASVTVGRFHKCAIDTAGALFCWGGDEYGETGHATAQYAPTQVGADTDWVSVTAGANHTCAIKTDNTAWCMGRNEDGQLGRGFPSTSGMLAIVDGPTFVAIDAGASHTCGIGTGGYLYCWGRNSLGQLGDGFTFNRESATFVDTPYTDWVSVAVGAVHSCAVRAGGELYCWGDGDLSQLGLGSTKSQLTPGQLSGTDWTHVDAGVLHNCATTTTQALWCWGYNNKGQLGLGDTTSRNTPTQVAPDGSAERFATGDRFTLVLEPIA